MRIVLDARTVTNHFPGIGRYVFNLGQAMAPLLKADNLVLLRDATQPAAWDLKAITGERVEIIDLPVSPFSVRQQWIIPRLLRQLQAQLYHSPYYLMPYRPGVPTVLTVYDLIPLRYPRYSSVRARALFRWATALALRAATRVITISESTRHDLMTTYRVPAAKVKTILLAADPVFQPQPAPVVADLRRRLGLPEQYVLYLGSNKPHKNLIRLVKAWAQIKPRSCLLVIAGAWDARYPQVKEQVQALALEKTVCFLGPVAEKDMPAMYSGAALFVFPSEYEGFGLPVLEAMACGAPAACANTSSLPEVAGDAALTFNPTKTDDIAAVLARLLADDGLRANLVIKGKRQTANFSWGRVAQATLEMYRELLS